MMHATLFVIIGLIFGLLAALMAFGITYVECESISSWVGSCGRSHCVDVHVGVLMLSIALGFALPAIIK
jgi:hypothetical protein